MSDVIEWLESDEGWEWSRDRTRWQPSTAAPATYRTPGPVDEEWDPCGRPHASLEDTKDAATEEVT